MSMIQSPDLQAFLEEQLKGPLLKLLEKIEESRLEIYDCKNMIDLRLKALGNEEEIS